MMSLGMREEGSSASLPGVHLNEVRYARSHNAKVRDSRIRKNLSTATTATTAAAMIPLKRSVLLSSFSPNPPNSPRTRHGGKSYAVLQLLATDGDLGEEFEFAAHGVVDWMLVLVVVVVFAFLFSFL